jgi:pilus assembly protein Flp/PilA
MLRKFMAEETGATAIEYGLIAALFGVTMIAAFGALRAEYIAMFENIANGVINANNP